MLHQLFVYNNSLYFCMIILVAIMLLLKGCFFLDTTSLKGHIWNTQLTTALRKNLSKIPSSTIWLYTSGILNHHSSYWLHNTFVCKQQCRLQCLTELLTLMLGYLSGLRMHWRNSALWIRSLRVYWSQSAQKAWESTADAERVWEWVKWVVKIDIQE